MALPTNLTALADLKGAKYAGQWVDMKVFDAQRAEDERTLKQDTTKSQQGLSKDNLGTFGFYFRKLPRGDGSGDSVWHVAYSVSGEPGLEARYVFSADAYETERGARKSIASNASEASLPRQYIRLADVERRQLVRNLQGVKSDETERPGAINLIDALTQKQEEYADNESIVDVAFALLKWAMVESVASQPGVVRRIMPTIEKIEALVYDEVWSGTLSNTESLACKLALNQSDRDYRRMRKLEQKLEGSSNKVPLKAIGPDFQKQFLPGEIHNVVEDVASRGPMMPRHRHIVLAYSFGVEESVTSIIKDLVKLEAARFLELNDTEEAIGAALGDACGGTLRLSALVRKGADGAGIEATAASMSKNAFRGDFVVNFLSVLKDLKRDRDADADTCNGKCDYMSACEDCGKRPFYQNPNPNSKLTAHPVVVANVSEDNTFDLSSVMADFEDDFDALHGTKLEFKVWDVDVEVNVAVYNAMYDVKLENKAIGLMSAAADFSCGFCATPKADFAKESSLAAPFRTDKDWEKAAEAFIRPDLEASLEQRHEESEGIATVDSLMNRDASRRIMDALHSDIRGSEWLKSVIIHEMANLTNKWTVSGAAKAAYREASARFDEHVRTRVGLWPLLMMGGNYARTMMDPRNLDAMVGKIADAARRGKMRALLVLWQKMRKSWRPVGNPRDTDEGRTLVASYDADRRAFLATLNADFAYVEVALYVHYVLAHVPAWLNKVDSIGALSAEALEANHREWRWVREHLARSDSRGLEDTLRVMWLRAHPALARIIFLEITKQNCGYCGVKGHNRLTCAKGKAALAAEEAKEEAVAAADAAA